MKPLSFSGFLVVAFFVSAPATIHAAEKAGITGVKLAEVAPQLSGPLSSDLGNDMLMGIQNSKDPAVRALLAEGPDQKELRAKILKAVETLILTLPDDFRWEAKQAPTQTSKDGKPVKMEDAPEIKLGEPVKRRFVLDLGAGVKWDEEVLVERFLKGPAEVRNMTPPIGSWLGVRLRLPQPPGFLEGPPMEAWGLARVLSDFEKPAGK